MKSSAYCEFGPTPPCNNVADPFCFEYSIKVKCKQTNRKIN